jgi:AraC-like DNA-binding protein
MLAKNYLFLRLVRLRHAEDWLSDGDGLCFIFPKAGSGTYSSSSAVYPLVPGDALAVNSAVGGTITVSAGDFVFWSFSLTIEHLFPLFASMELCLLQSLADSFRSPKFYPASSSVARECHKLLTEAPPQFNLDHRTHILRVASPVLSCEFNRARSQRCGFVRIEEHLTQVFEKLSIDEILNLSLLELANRFSCSRRHLNRLFNQHFGLSVARLRMEMRLLKAVSLLRDPDTKVIDVAGQCGFHHLGLFNTCFKRRFGTSPGLWRKRGSTRGNSLLVPFPARLMVDCGASAAGKLTSDPTTGAGSPIRVFAQPLAQDLLVGPGPEPGPRVRPGQ